MNRLKVWWRRAMNKDGPWTCLTCGTTTVTLAGCSECGRRMCSCWLDGFAGCDFDPDCDHHGLQNDAVALHRFDTSEA